MAEMNKFQKSLDRIKENLPLHDDKWTDEDKEHILTVMQALEKQIPKKPIEDGYYDEPCVCPNCGSSVINEADNDYRFSCCYHCGQALDWSNTE